MDYGPLVKQTRLLSNRAVPDQPKHVFDLFRVGVVFVAETEQISNLFLKRPDKSKNNNAEKHARV